MREIALRSAIALALLVSRASAGTPDWVVDVLADESNSACVPAGCSLREAIAGASAGQTIGFALPGSPPWTIRLSSTLTVSLLLTIEGPGATDLLLSGDSDGNGTGNVRNLLVDAAGELTLSGMTLRDGLVTSTTIRDGGCVRVLGDLVLDAVRFENCKAWVGGITQMNLSRGGEGGAIYVASGATLSATDSNFVSNAAGQGEIGPSGTTAGPGGRGGAIATAGAVSIARATFSSNAAGKGGTPNGNGGAGGAIAVLADGSLLLEDSTLAANRSGDGSNDAFGPGADGVGGGLDLEADATLNNVTLSGNTIGGTGVGAAAVGGGIVVAGGTARLRNVTIAGNVANGAGGGLARTGGTAILRNSILDSNIGAGTNDDCTTNLAGSFQSEGYNILRVRDGCGTSLLGTDQSGTAAAPLPIWLGAFGSYGGPTSTYSLTSLSPALDGGDPAGCEAWDPVGETDLALAFDQRGEPRPVDGDGDSAATCDAGAYEAPEPPKYALTVVIAGDGEGSVASSVPGIDCPGDCDEEYFNTQTVELFAAPSDGSFLFGWSGDCSGASCELEMTTGRSATATFLKYLIFASSFESGFAGWIQVGG